MLAYSIWPVVSCLDGDRVIISIIKRMMASHSCLKSHLGWIGIVESPMCIWSQNYETVNHVLWGCERFDAERPQLQMDLRLTDIEWGIPIRNILGGRSLRRWEESLSLVAAN
jgi:hypothetical protein